MGVNTNMNPAYPYQLQSPTPQSLPLQNQQSQSNFQPPLLPHQMLFTPNDTINANIPQQATQYPYQQQFVQQPSMYSMPNLQTSQGYSAKVLVPGELFPIGTSMLRIGFFWELVQVNAALPITLDAATFSLKGDGKVGSSTDMTFYNNRQSTDGSVFNHGGNLVSTSEGDLEQISVDLTRVSPDTLNIAFVLSLYEADDRKLNFGCIRNLFIRVTDAVSNAEMCRFYFCQDGRNFQSVIMAKLSLQNGSWYLLPVGDGAASMRVLSRSFGVNTM